VTDPEHVRLKKNELHFRAFLPSSKSSELSIMRTETLSESDVWRFGDTAVAEASGRRIVARGDFLAPHVRESFAEPWRLKVVVDEPPARHALVQGWPPPGESEIRKSLAQQLRARATLRVRPLTQP
jgi:hypothetical protein